MRSEKEIRNRLEDLIQARYEVEAITLPDKINSIHYGAIDYIYTWLISEYRWVLSSDKKKGKKK